MLISEIIANSIDKKGSDIKHVVSDVNAVVNYPDFFSLKKIGKLPSGQIIWSSSDPEGLGKYYPSKKISLDSKAHLYFTTSPQKPKEAQMILSTFDKSGWKGEWINYLKKTENATHDATSLYLFLLNQKKILIAWTQSPGALAVWRKLAKQKGVEIHGWDQQKSKAVNIDPLLRDEEETHEPDELPVVNKAEHNEYRKTHGQSIRNLLLIASKK